MWTLLVTNAWSSRHFFYFAGYLDPSPNEIKVMPEDIQKIQHRLRLPVAESRVFFFRLLARVSVLGIVRLHNFRANDLNNKEEKIRGNARVKMVAGGSLSGVQRQNQQRQ